MSRGAVVEMALHFPPALLCSPRFSSSSCPHNERIIKHRMQQASSCQPSVTEQTGIWTAAQCVWRATDNSWEKDGVTTQHWQHSCEKMYYRGSLREDLNGEEWKPFSCDVRVDTLIVSVAFFFLSLWLTCWTQVMDTWCTLCMDSCFCLWYTWTI